MKNNFFFVVIASALLLTTSCNETVDTEQLLQDETTRQQVFKTITADHEMMTDFMESMMGNEHAMMMMKGHEGMKSG